MSNPVGRPPKAHVAPTKGKTVATYARFKLRAWMSANGKTYTEVCHTFKIPIETVQSRFVGPDRAPISFWPTVEAWCGVPGCARYLGMHCPRTPDLDAEVDEVFDAAEDAERRIAKQYASAAGCPDLELLFLNQLKLALYARTASVREKATADLIDRIGGKAINRSVTFTPTGPTSSPALIEKFRQALAPRPKQLPPPKDQEVDAEVVIPIAGGSKAG